MIFHNVYKTKSCGKKWKNDDLHRCPTAVWEQQCRRLGQERLRGCPDFHLFLSNVWNREIWCWKSILEWPHHWPLQWEVPFGMGLSFYDIVIAPTARADAKFGFLEAGTQSTIIVYSFVKIWDTCPKCWRLEMFENIFKTFPYFKNGIWSASRLLTLYWNVLTAIDCQ